MYRIYEELHVKPASQTRTRSHDGIRESVHVCQRYLFVGNEIHHYTISELKLPYRINAELCVIVKKEKKRKRLVLMVRPVVPSFVVYF